MKRFIVIAFIPMLVLLLSCDSRHAGPTDQTDTGSIVPEVPETVRNMLDRYSWDNSGGPGGWHRAPADWLSPALVDSGFDVYAVTILWGDFFNTDSQNNVTTDWSGTLSLNAEGRVDVRLAIDFEPGQDSVIPHNSVHFAAWASYTNGDFDGLSFVVYVNRQNLYFTPPMLTFETVPFTQSWDFETLVDFSAFYLVDGQRAVAVHSRRIWPSLCAGGFIVGQWIKDGIFADSGQFNGFWIGRAGDTIGCLSGTFWTNADNTHQFAGEISGLVTDQVIGDVYGTWMYDDPRLCPMCGTGHGLFRGRYDYLNEDNSGRVWGVFGDYSLPLEEVTLPMHGLWRQDCPAISVSNVNNDAY